MRVRRLVRGWSHQGWGALLVLLLAGVAPADPMREELLRRDLLRLQDQADRLRDDNRLLEADIKDLTRELADLAKQREALAATLPELARAATEAGKGRDGMKVLFESVKKLADAADLKVRQVTAKLYATIDAEPRMVEARAAHQRARERVRQVRDEAVAKLNDHADYRAALSSFQAAEAQARKLREQAEVSDAERSAVAIFLMEKESAVRRMERQALEQSAEYKKAEYEAETARLAMVEMRSRIEGEIAEHPERKVAAAEAAEKRAPVAGLQEKFQTAEDAAKAATLKFTAAGQEVERMKKDLADKTDLRASKSNQIQANLMELRSLNQRLAALEAQLRAERSRR